MFDRIIYEELARNEARRHHHKWAKTRKQAFEPSLPCQNAEAIEYWALRAMTLVYLRKQRVCGLGKDCGGKTSDDATAKQDRELAGGREVGACLLGHTPESNFMA